MKAITIGYKGLEPVMQAEIKVLLGKDSDVKDSVCIFDIDSYEDLCKLVYFGQSFSKAFLLLNDFKFKTTEDIAAKKIDTDLIKGKSIKIDCKRVGSHDFKSVQVEEEIGEKLDNKIDFKNPEVVIGVYIFDDQCYIGIDFAGIDLSKRDYKVFPHPSGIKGTLAYALVNLSGWKDDEVLLDCYSKDGTVCIEAAAYGKGVSLNKFRKDKLAYTKMFDYSFDESDKEVKIFGYEKALAGVKASQKNARIIGLHKDINFSRVDVEWLDTKFGKCEVDKIVTYLPFISKRTNAKQVEKELGEFFHQATFVLKDDGRCVVLVKDIELIKEKAEKEKMKVVKSINVDIGKEKFSIAVVEKDL